MGPGSNEGKKLYEKLTYIQNRKPENKNFRIYGKEGIKMKKD